MTKDEKHGKDFTLVSLAKAVEAEEIKPSEAQKEVKKIHEKGFTEAYFSKEDANKMVYAGSKENSLLMLDRLDSERIIQRSTWRKMREYVEIAQGKKTEEKEAKKNPKKSR